MLISYIKNNVVPQPALAMGVEGICIMEKMTQYGEFGCTCIFWHNYAFKISHFLNIHNYIVSVEGIVRCFVY